MAKVAPQGEAEAGKAIEIGAPPQQAMTEVVNEVFNDQVNGLLVKQTMRGCCQECMGCEAKSEFTVAPLDWTNIDGYNVNSTAMGKEDTMYALEKSSFCMRCCWRDGRGFNMKVSKGKEAGGQEIVQYRKPCGFPLVFSIPTKDGSIDCPCCCLLPNLHTELPDGTPLNSQSKYICDQNLWVPKLKYYENGEAIYMVKPETCCGGCCIACNCCSGKGCIYIPFYFHDAKSGEVIGGGYNDNAPQIRKVWAGLKKECCSTADTFAVNFPKDCKPDRKAGLLGMTFLIDFTVFERQQDSGGGV